MYMLLTLSLAWFIHSGNLTEFLDDNGLDLEDDPVFIVDTLIRERVHNEMRVNLTRRHVFADNNTDNDERIAITNVFFTLRCRVVSPNFAVY